MLEITKSRFEDEECITIYRHKEGTPDRLVGKFPIGTVIHIDNTWEGIVQFHAEIKNEK